MIVVSDTSPIINLAMIGHLDILNQVFGQIIIPESVFYEITIQGSNMPGAQEVRDADWIEVRKCTDENFLKVLLSQVDIGEAQAIALAFEIKADVILIDERAGRQLAKDLNIPVLGLLGVFRVAKSNGLIQYVKPLIDRLVQEAGFRINQNLYISFLEEVGENIG